jgi:hypothetical protein
MKKMLIMAITVIIGIALIPIIVTSVNRSTTQDVSIDYTITSAGVLGDQVNSLTAEELEYIEDHEEYITGHSDVSTVGSITDSYVSIDSTPVNDFRLNFDTFTYIFTYTTDILVIDDQLLTAGTQDVSINFSDVPIEKNYTSILLLLPLIFVAGIIGLIYVTKENGSD